MRIRLIVILLLSLTAPQLRGQINTESVVQIGRNALYYEDYALSIQYFNQAIQAKPYLYAPYFFRAIAKYYLGDYHGAIADCDLSIERDPYIAEVYRLRAINHIRTDNFKDASRDYYILLDERNQRDRDIWYNLVLCQTQLKEHTEADRLLDTMIVRWPDYARSYLLKAQIAIAQTDTLRADSLLSHALRLDSADTDAWAAYALLALQRQENKKAEEAYTKAILLSPQQAGYYINRALSRYQQKNLREAMNDYNAALQLQPDNYLAHYNRALLRMQVGENNLAIEDFDFVLQRRPTDRLALYNRAILAQQTGDFERAIRDYSLIIAEFEEFASAYINRAYCYRQIGDRRHSEADERKVIQLQLSAAYTHKEITNPLDSITREKDQDNIEDYDKLVTDNTDNLAPFYASEYRGKVQNRQVSLELQPLYQLTFFPADNGLYATTNKAPFIDEQNQTNQLKMPLSLATREIPMTDAQYHSLKAERMTIESSLLSEHDNTDLLLAHALYLTAECDYTSALQDINQHLDHHKQSIIALILRSQIKARQIELQESKTAAAPAPSESRLTYASAISDLSEALRLESNSAILYYNRATLYALSGDIPRALQDYDRALEHDPTLAEAYYNRAILYTKTKNQAAAIQDYSKAGELGLFTAYSLLKQIQK